MLLARAILRQSRLFSRASSTSTKTNSQTSASDKDLMLKDDDAQEVDLVPEKPIKGLNLISRVNQIEKKGSFSVDLFAGSYDADFLIYPEPLDTRIENKQLKDQARMVSQMWPQIWDDPIELQRYNFFNLYQLSVSEMMTIFEAIGKSTRKCYEVRVPSLRHIDYNALPHQVAVTNSIIDLVTRNCLTYWPMNLSENSLIKEHLPKKHVVFGEPQPTEELYPKISFCWTEKAPGLGSLPPQEWQTLGSHGGPSSDFYLIEGQKHGVLFEENVDHFLVYYRDKFLAEKAQAGPDGIEPNPASDPLVGCCLLPKSQVQGGSVYTDSAGFKYFDLDISATIPGNLSVFPAERNNPHAVNVKALGQIATCAVVMGILKDSLQQAYQYLIEHKEGLLNCEIIKKKLVDVTAKIFAIESMIFYIAGMYDGLKPGFDAHMEAAICKIITTEYAFGSLLELQRIFGSDMFMTSKIQDQINIFDSFLDGNIYNRLYVSTMGVLWYARSKNAHLNQLRLHVWHPGYLTRTLFRESIERNNYLKLNADLYGNLHPTLAEAAENLEFVARRVSYATETICRQYGEHATAAQCQLYDLSQLSMDTFMLTTMMARASKSYCNGSRYSEFDVVLATHYSRELARNVRLYIDELELIRVSGIKLRASVMHEANLKLGGYYAESPLDPNI